MHFSGGILLLFLLPHLARLADRNGSPITCNFGAGRCTGEFEFRLRKRVSSSTVPLAQFKSTRENCTISCTLKPNCWVIEHTVGADRVNCRLFGKVANDIPDDNYISGTWKCCDENACRSQPRRCPGMWSRRYSTSLQGPRILSTTQHPFSSLNCVEKCLTNPYCAYVNFLDSSRCELLEFDQERTYLNNSNSRIYEWKCCSYTNNDLPKQCRSFPGKCKGVWKVSKVKPNFAPFAITQFFSMDKLTCLKVCGANPLCHEVLFSQVKAKCFLLSNKTLNLRVFNTTRPLSVPISHWYSYKWTCCTPYEFTPLPKSAPRKDAKCMCFNSKQNNRLIVAADGCTEPLVHNLSLMKSTLAAFWVEKEAERYKSQGDEWMRVFNGNLYVWVSITKTKYSSCSTDHCSIFSTIVRNDDQFEIVSRSEWFALPSKKPLVRFPVRPKMVVISNTVADAFGCYSKEMCGYFVRLFQIAHLKYRYFDDIAYNYLIGEDGRIYEGRGGDFISSTVDQYDLVSISIAFIGWYENRLPNVKSLIAVRQLLKDLVKKGKLSSNYVLYGHRDLRESQAPGKYLYLLMPNWGHYVATKITEGYSCQDLFASLFRRRVACIVGPTTLFFVIIAVILLYLRIYKHETWCPCRQICASRKRSNARKMPRIRCLVSSCRSARQFSGGWPAACTNRQAESLQIQPLGTEVISVISRNLDCRCQHFFTLLWNRCVRDSLFEFPCFLKVSKTGCSAHTILWLMDKVYLLHGNDIPDIQSMIEHIADGKCICRAEHFFITPIEVPKLDSQMSFAGDKITFDASRILNQQLHRFEKLETYCRLFERQDDGYVETTYRQFKNELFEEEAPWNDTSSTLHLQPYLQK